MVTWVVITTGFFVFGTRRLFWYCRKGSFSALGRPDAHQLLEHAWTESERKPSALSRGSFVCPPTWTGSKTAFSPADGFFLLPYHVSLTKKNLPLSGQGFRWPLCSPDRDSTGPRC